MKTNTKTKKTIATKTVKTPVKKAKPIAKTPAKKVVGKAVNKPVSKSVAKKPVAKKVVAPAKAKTKPAKASAKPTKVALAPVKKAEKSVKTPVKAVKPVKEVTKSAQKTAQKAVSTPIIVKMPENSNQNSKMAAKPVVRTSMFVASRPVNMATSKSSSGTYMNTSAANRPVYRPIQVINKPAAAVQPVRQMAPIAKESEKVEFKKGDYVVYPAHGVGEIEAVESQTIGGMEIKLYAIAFEKDRMRLKVPVFKAHASGLRRLSTTNRMDDALKTLQGRAQIRRAMWSRRAQEYETKINSGDPVSIAEVLRDLKRSNDETEQSYSERQIYQSALERLAREVAAVEKITEIEAAERLENMIRSKRSRASSTQDAPKEAANA
jgi:CarD family transcriptional regulator